jgi:hypothetical protein
MRGTYFAILVFVLGAIWILPSSSSFQSCVDKQRAAESQQVKENPPPIVLSNNAAICVRCTGHVLYEYRDAITAIATVFIAAFTFTLWRSTKRMTQATAESVRIAERSLADLERPYIYVFNPSGFKIDLNREDPFNYFQYSIANYGKTPARIESAFVGISAGIGPKHPDAVLGWHDFLVSPLFVSGERRDNPTASVPNEIQIIETADENGQYDTPVLTDGSEFFLWIIIKYSGPFSKGHETSACWRWSSDSRRLVLHEKHNSQK